jgi:hypothetical protein
MRFYIVAFMLLAFFSTTSYGQSAPRPNPTPTPTTIATTSAPTPEPERVVNRDLKTQIFEIKHRDPFALAKVLRGLGSDDRGTQLVPDKDFKTITVRDYQENISVMERAINKLDIPEKIPANLEFQLHVVAASRSTKDKEALPKNLEDVAIELQKTLQYSSYRYLTSILTRVQDGKDSEGQGYADAIFSSSSTTDKPYYLYFLRGIKLNMDASGEEIIQIDKLIFELKLPSGVAKKDTVDFRQATLGTSLSLRENEKVVVGTASIGGADDAIILVVSVKKIK